MGADRHRMAELLGEGTRPFAPMEADHPLVGDECYSCSIPFKVGDVPTLAAFQPDGDEEAKKADEGRPYRAQAKPVHWSCVIDTDDPEGDWKLYEEVSMRALNDLVYPAQALAEMEDNDA